MKNSCLVDIGIAKHCRILLSAFVLMLTILMSPNCLRAQDVNKAEITLKSGVIIKGAVIQVDPLQRVVLNTPSIDSLDIPWNIIAEIDLKPDLGHEKRTPLRDSTIYFNLSLGARATEGRWSFTLIPHFSGSLGYQFNQYLGLGASVGVEQHWTPYINIIPMGLEVRGRLKPGHASPFYSLRTGYVKASLAGVNAPEESVQGKLFINPSVGILVKRNSAIAWYMSFDFMQIHMHEEVNEWTWSGGVRTPVLINRDRVLNAIGLTFGAYFD